LRNVIFWCNCSHIFFFVMCLALVGFKEMLENLWLSFWSYSVYLSLREWTIIIYLLLIIFVLYDRVYSKEGTYIAPTEPSYSILGHVIIVLGYCLNLWFTFKAYIWFRKYGGIKGFRRDGDFDEEEAW